MATIALDDIQASGLHGETVDGIHERHPDWDRGTLARRVTDLREAGHVYDSGARRTTRKGYPAVVWVAVDCTQVDPSSRGAT